MLVQHNNAALKMRFMTQEKHKLLYLVVMDGILVEPANDNGYPTSLNKSDKAGTTLRGKKTLSLLGSNGHISP